MPYDPLSGVSLSLKLIISVVYGAIFNVAGNRIGASILRGWDLSEVLCSKR
jgi:hypothetical protein